MVDLEGHVSLHGKGIPVKLLTSDFFNVPIKPTEWMKPIVVAGCTSVTKVEDNVLWLTVNKHNRPWCEKT